MQYLRLQQVNAYLNDAPDWRPLGVTGTTNTLYRAEVAGQSLIVRLNAPTTLAFGVERRREAQVLARIGSYDWAPDILHNAWPQGWCLMRDHGQPLAPNPLGAADKERLLAAVADWQRLAGEPVFDYAALLQQYGRYLERETMDEHRLPQQLLAAMEQVLERLPPVPSCLVHHDLHPGNLCRDGDQLVVLDWEYAGIGNPWFDAAALCLQFELSLERIHTLPAFRDLSAHRLHEGLQQAQWLVAGLELLWYWCRGLQGVALTLDQLQARTRRLLAQRPI